MLCFVLFLGFKNNLFRARVNLLKQSEWFLLGFRMEVIETMGCSEARGQEAGTMRDGGRGSS